MRNEEAVDRANRELGLLLLHAHIPGILRERSAQGPPCLRKHNLDRHHRAATWLPKMKALQGRQVLALDMGAFLQLPRHYPDVGGRHL